MTVLGHCLENGEIKPIKQHIEDVLKIRPQTTKAGVRAILGILGYHRQFIPNFAELTYDLTKLLKKSEPDKNIRWESVHTDALERVKTILTSNSVLVPPRHDQGYIIASDATDRTIASILMQEDDNGVHRNVAYFSKKLLPNQQNWSVMEKEAYGILASVIKWHNYVYGHKIVAITDHRALEFLDSVAKHNSRIARWKIIFNNYEITTRYRRGQDHINCDALSRIEI
jgi:RNase H-like domain found in reverse transcriptase